MRCIKSYPITLRGKKSGAIVRFSNITSGVVLNNDSNYKQGYYSTDWLPATNSSWLEYNKVSKRDKLIAKLKKLLSDEEELSKYTKVHQIGTRQTFFTWVNELGGYFAYCHSDGRLIVRTGHSTEHTDRTWSSVGKAVLEKELK